MLRKAYQMKRAVRPSGPQDGAPGVARLDPVSPLTPNDPFGNVPKTTPIFAKRATKEATLAHGAVLGGGADLIGFGQQKLGNTT